MQTRSVSFALCCFITSAVIPVSARNAVADSITSRYSSAQLAADTTAMLNEISVTSHSRKLISTGNMGSMTLNVDALGRVTRAFGEADPLRYAAMAGGMSAVGDYSSGISVQGAGFQHTLFRVGKAMVFFPYHFGGIYSMFNGIHFPSLTVEKGIHNASFPSRLGGLIEISSRNGHPDRIHASVNLGMTASSLGIRMPVSERFSIDLSCRISYLDKLYGPLLDLEDQKIDYMFGDAALTARWTPSDADMLKFDAVFNSDRLTVLDRHFQLNTRLRWGNLASSLSWKRSGKVPVNVWVAYSGFRNTLGADMPGFDLWVPSSIMEVKAGAEILSYIDTRNFRKGAFKTGMELAYLEASPQQTNGNKNFRSASEIRVYSSWIKEFLSSFKLNAGLKGSFYSSKGYQTLFVSPAVTLSYDDGENEAAVSCSVYPQYLHQTGFADIGLSSNFWFPASEDSPRQIAAAVSLSYTRSLFGGHLLLGIEPYFKRMLHEPEYSGILLDLIERNYNLDSHLLHSNGFNTGFDITARFSAGRFTGNVAYSLGIARRRFATAPDRYLPALSEGLHNVNSLLNCRLGRGWNVSASFVLASGRCYTPVKSLYMIGESLMMVYGDRNSARLPLYNRLDLSGSYSFKTGGDFPLSHSVVLSLINAYGRRNIELCSYRYSSEDGTFYLHRVSSLYRFLPSLSYTIEF